MGLNYICSNSTYDLTGSEYTTVFDKKKRLNYIVSGTINQLGLTTDSSASVYSPLKFNISGDDYYIGRSTTFNTTSSTSTLTTVTKEAYYTLFTATASGSSNGSNSNMTSTSRYVYSTAASYSARLSTNSSTAWESSVKSYSFSASTTTSRDYGTDTFSASTYTRSSTKSDFDVIINGFTTRSVTINGNGTIANKTTSYMTSYANIQNTKIESTEYKITSSKSINTRSISMSGTTSCRTYINYNITKETQSTTSVLNYTASTYSTRYTSTYTGTISGVNLNATSTELTYSIRQYIYNTSISTTTIDSSHNFV